MELKETLAKDTSFIKGLMAQDGPNHTDYKRLNDWYLEIGHRRKHAIYSEKEIDFLRAEFGETYLSSKALQGFVYMKPHGYRGDFEIIDKIYLKHISPDSKYKKWDIWFHSLAATKAVRNRKTYFKKLLETKAKADSLQVLNLASGPCRGMAEYFKENPENTIQFDCIELDPNAITFAKSLLQKEAKNVNFIKANIFRYKPEHKYDLIWSAGLFDYFDDKIFVGILKRYKECLMENGEIIIGNFHTSNSSRCTMEFGMWYLHHRTEAKLIDLAMQAGYQKDKINIERESEGVNLFMRIQH